MKSIYVKNDLISNYLYNAWDTIIKNLQIKEKNGTSKKEIINKIKLIENLMKTNVISKDDGNYLLKKLSAQYIYNILQKDNEDFTWDEDNTEEVSSNYVLE